MSKLVDSPASNCIWNRNKRLLLVSPLAPPAGGVATWTKVVVDDLSSDSGVAVSVVDTAVRWRAPGDDRLSARLFGGAVQALRDWRRTFLRMIAEKSECVHINTSGSFSAIKDRLILRSAQRLGVRRVIHYHVGFLPWLAEQKNLHWKAVFSNMKAADETLVLGKACELSLRSHVGNVSMRGVVNPIKICHDKAPQSHVSRVRIKVLFLGRVVRDKGVYTLVEAAKGMRDIDFELHMVGAVSENVRSELLSSVNQGSNSWLKFTGEIKRDECRQMIATSDFLVLPSIGLFEAFPYAILEAMEAGVPVIATDRGAIREILDIDGSAPCGLLVDSGSPESLRVAIMQLINNPDLKFTLGVNGWHRVREYFSSTCVIRSLMGVWFPADQWSCGSHGE